MEVVMKSLKVIFFVVLLVGIFSVPLFAEETETSGTASVDVMSNYVWRGITLSHSYSVQPSVGITYGGFSTSLWSSWDSDYGNSDQGELAETDLVLEYARSFDKLSLAAGYIYYGLDTIEDTQEVYLTVGYDVILNPSLTVYYDYDIGQGAFAELSVGHTFEFGKITLDLGALASYNFENEVMGFDENGEAFSGLYNGSLSASVTVPVTEAISVSPKIAYTFPLSDDAETAIESLSVNGESSALYGGVGVALSF